MKVLIAAVNSQFIHASPVPWILKASCRDLNVDIQVMEFSINDRFDRVAGDLILAKPDILSFSCYIWNIDYVIKLVLDVKKMLPETCILLGGPEAEHRHDLSKFGKVIKGDGEVSFRNIVAEKIGATPIFGDPFLEDKELYIQAAKDICEMGKGRIVYLETIRGCPFTCAYCLASRVGRVRQQPLDLVFKLIDIYMDSDVRQVKFVDRTFNVDTARAYEIIRYIFEEHSKRTKAPESWHFEVAADLFDERLFELIETLPDGLIQFEVGVQSLNEKVLTTSTRKTNINKVLENLKRLLSYGNCLVHADLIAGLPGEDIESFKNGFDLIHSVAPHQLQLGFLKVLHGTKMREMPLVWSENPPYRVLESDCINAEELRCLEGIEEVVERCWNNGRFNESIEYISDKCYFDFYLFLSNWLEEKGMISRPLSASAMAEQLYLAAEQYKKAHKSLNEKINLLEFRKILIIDLLTSCYPVKIPTCISFEAPSKDELKKAMEFAKEKYGMARRHFEPLGNNLIMVLKTENKKTISGRLEYFIV